jgi:hypothetical protein
MTRLENMEDTFGRGNPFGKVRFGCTGLAASMTPPKGCSGTGSSAEPPGGKGVLRASAPTDRRDAGGALARVANPPWA